MTALALHAEKSGRPRSAMFTVARRVAKRFEPATARAFLRAVDRLMSQIDDAMLVSAVASGSLDRIMAAIGGGNLAGLLATDESLRNAFLQTARASGAASAEVLRQAGLPATFNAVDPNAVIFARERAAQLVVAVGEDVREAIRIVLAVGQEVGLTTVQQARAIREVVGLPPNWASAPANLARELRAGTFTETRRLSGADKARIRSRIARGTVNDAFVDEMMAKYSASLRNRRALNIARTETLRASHFGQRMNWEDAMRKGVLPKTARRMFIVTPDDRLRATHAAVPGMNPNGVPLDEPFQTPFGAIMDPPLEPNCRCGVGLVFPGLRGTL